MFLSGQPLTWSTWMQMSQRCGWRLHPVGSALPSTSGRSLLRWSCATGISSSETIYYEISTLSIYKCRVLLISWLLRTYYFQTSYRQIVALIVLCEISVVVDISWSLLVFNSLLSNSIIDRLIIHSFCFWTDFSSSIWWYCSADTTDNDWLGVVLVYRSPRQSFAAYLLYWCMCVSL